MATGSTLLPFARHKMLLLLLMLPWYECIWNLKLVSAVAVTRNETATHCVVVVANSEVEKHIGSVWVSSTNPCAIHACEADDSGLAHETITKEDCGQYYCDVDSELRAENGTCCGTCVRTKCRYNDNIYEIGNIWHNKNDCTILECSQQSNGESIINVFAKTCAPLPPDCAAEDIYTDNCCQFCRNKGTPRNSFSESDDIWTEEFYKNHPCVRNCQLNEPPKTCQYNFVVEWYQTLSKACFDCPQNATDCNNPHCIVGDGITRSITVVNRMMPGPSIEVCQNDIIVVDVQNQLLGESTTIHWHGLHQVETPYMDGVPHITQCPISPHATFRYTFKADNPGTHFWHSHTGMQRGDGVFGALIVRRPRNTDPHAHLYDFDLTEHKMLVQDWVHVPGVSMFANHHHSIGDNKPRNLLINGHGRYYKAIWEQAKSDAKKNARAPAATNNDTTATNSTTPLEVTTIANHVADAVTELRVEKSATQDIIDLLHDVDITDVNMRLERSNRYIENSTNNLATAHKAAANNIKQLPHSKVSHVEYVSTAATVQTTKSSVPKSEIILDTTTPKLNSKSTVNNAESQNRTKRETEDDDISLDEIPLQVYTVRAGFRYRFRIINAEFLNCPITVSIDNHTLLAINSDGYDFEPVEVGSIVTYAGERFDFILIANQSIGNYWVRLKGLMDCSEKFTSAFQVAILRYVGAAVEEPTAALGYSHKAEGIELNAMNRGSGHVDSLTIAELTGLNQYDTMPGLNRNALKPVADYKFFVYYDFYEKDNPVFHLRDYYGIGANMSELNRLYTPQLNHISLEFPSVALLSARDTLDDTQFCNETSLAQQGIDCRKEFCKCHHMLQVPLNAVVEFIIVDEGFTYDANHPFHLHGNAFRVVGLERLGTNVTIEMVKQLDRYNLLKRNLVRPPVKDTVTIPDGGYTIIRFEAYNPGFWLFHCHIEFHAEIGMALILKVGNNDEMVPIPKNFPTCHDYMPTAKDEEDDIKTTTKQSIKTTTISPDNNGNNSATRQYTISSMIYLWAISMIVGNILKVL